jgi:hypothetical protein
MPFSARKIQCRPSSIPPTDMVKASAKHGVHIRGDPCDSCS